MPENNLCSKLIQTYGKYMRLKIFVDTDDELLKQKYAEYIKNREEKMLSNIDEIDAGFDLFTPDEPLLMRSSIQKIDYKIICAAKIINRSSSYNTGFYMYPRSSISKSSLRLANNVGIIDSGYRGHLIGMFDIVYGSNVSIKKFERHLQICSPELMPIFVELVDSIEELGGSTIRGSGGFGSTGL